MKIIKVPNNFFGITELQKNPLPNDIKQQLALVLFLHPNISAEEALTISKNYITKSSAEAYINRMQEDLDSIDYRKVRKALYEDFKNWIAYHNFPVYEELVYIEYSYAKPTWKADDMEYELCKAMTNATNLGTQRWIKYLYAYAHTMSLQSIDYYLDQYNTEFNTLCVSENDLKTQEI